MEEQRSSLRGAMQVGSSLPVVRRLYVGRWRRVSVISAASFLDGLARASVLVSLVNVGVGLAAGDSVLEGSLGAVGGFSAGTGALLGAALVLLAIVIVLDIVAAVLSSRMSVDVLARERVAAYRAYADTSWSVQAAERDGHLQELLSKNAGWTGSAVNSSISGGVATFSLIALGLSAILVEPIVALVLVAAVGGLVVAARPMLGMVRRRTKVVAGQNVDFANLIARNVGLARDIRTYDVGDEIRSDVDREIRRLSDGWFTIRLLNRLSPLLFRNAALLLVILAVGAVHVTGRGDLAAMGAVVVIVIRALSYAGAIQQSLQELHNSVPWLEQLWAQTAHFEENRIRRDGAPLPSIDTIRFDSVVFAYDDAGGDVDTEVLDGVDFCVARGESIGIVGPSGSGKSTLVKLLLRLHDPTEGRILADGRPATDFDLADWYQRVGYVPQNVITFNGTIGENISFFRPDVSTKAIEAAARRAHLHDDIVAMPDGYNTLVGERAGRLSGGQRQRLILARALVSSPDVLVLDEPTSALDMRSESLVHQTLEELRRVTTLFIVAHRISTLSVCDRIMVLEAGRLTALDTPERVRETNEFFREASRLARL